MKFYQGLLPRIIWDASKNKILLEFSTEGIFETEDENLIKLLRGKGYPLEADLIELERTGRLPHGGFEKSIGDHDLPSGRSPVEDPDSVHGVKPQVRQRVPDSEEAEMAQKKAEPKNNLPGDETKAKESKEKKSKRTIKRRSK